MNAVEERGRSAAHGDSCRAAEALFASWVVEMGTWDVCEAVGTVAVAHRNTPTHALAISIIIIS